MSILDRIRRGRRPDPVSTPPAAPPVGFDVEVTDLGAVWTIRGMPMDELLRGAAPADVEDQFIVLSILAEDGHAATTDDGFIMSSVQAASVNDALAHVLGLPDYFTGSFDTKVLHTTVSEEFDVQLRVRRQEHPEPYSRTGPCLTLGTDTYRLTPPMLQMMEAIERFHAIDPRDRDHDVDNVRLIAELHDARTRSTSWHPLSLNDQDLGSDGDHVLDIDLKHLDQFTSYRPDDVAVVLEPELDGSLRLLPDLHTGHDPVELLSTADARIWSRSSGVIRHGNDLVVLDQKPMASLQEIRRVGRIPAEEVQRFHEAPGAFLDLDKFDHELRFSVRVRAIGAIVPISMAEITGHDLKWTEDVDGVLEPEALLDLAQDAESLAAVEAAVSLAEESGAPHAVVDEQIVDVCDRGRVRRVLDQATRRLRELQDDTDEPQEDKVQIGIHLHESFHREQDLRSRAADAVLAVPVDLTGLARTPFPHQEEGITWTARLMDASFDGSLDSVDRIQGAILADDMGLGKTFMSLVAIRAFRDFETRRGQPNAPILVVVPLTLIENWEAEIVSTFSGRPFDDVVVLQAERDLPIYRYRDSQRESRAAVGNLDSSGMLSEDKIQFSLAVGGQAGPDRLDVPGRIVITTYETLASYQLSLSQIDWGVVLFDEAQRIKNPETLASRAAKGLKARFKLVTTGTPIENTLRDLWSLMDTAQPGLLGTWAAFRHTWARAIETGSPEEQAEHGRRLSELIRPFMLRRTKEEHLPNLPRKTIHSGVGGEGLVENERLYRTMPQTQSVEYARTMVRHRTRVKTKGGQLTTLHALRNISLHPTASSTADASPVGHRMEDSARLAATIDILDAVRKRGEKAIVFIINKAVQRHLAHSLHDRYGVHVDIINGETTSMSSARSASRRDLVERFQAREGFAVIIMSPLAAGTGLTVTGANHAIHAERHWNPAKEAQATDRIYRIGQTKDVHVYLPMSIHPDPEMPSFDLTLHQLLQRKSDLKDAVMVPEVGQKQVFDAMGI